ncbi:hypothetical protein ACWDUL_28485 [Nocardia niigatensis]|uniref:hypothetical protein n=1 Tax=Nocardia niigatensis TaxID=209249 RepID=UPI00031D774C|nr:hypothetical protein [Nocardia niigatensis]
MSPGKTATPSVPPIPPDHAVRSAHNVLKFGPFAGAVVQAANTNPKSAGLAWRQAGGGRGWPRASGCPGRIWVVWTA